MRGVISISEKVADLPLPDGGTAEVCATADGEYNEQEHRLTVTVDSFVRPADPLDPPYRALSGFQPVSRSKTSSMPMKRRHLCGMSSSDGASG